jgi:hypothetical protein
MAFDVRRGPPALHVLWSGRRARAREDDGEPPRAQVALDEVPRQHGDAVSRERARPDGRAEFP